MKHSVLQAPSVKDLDQVIHNVNWLLLTDKLHVALYLAMYVTGWKLLTSPLFRIKFYTLCNYPCKSTSVQIFQIAMPVSVRQSSPTADIFWVFH